MAGNTGSPGQSVASRTLAVLGAFERAHRALTLTEIADRAGLPVPTTHRLIGEIERWGGLARHPNGAYVVGRRLWEIGLLAPIESDLREVAAPFLQDLYAGTLATVHLAVRDSDQVLYLDRLSGRASVPVVSRVGGRLPLHATGVGNVLLAHAPEGLVASVLSDLRPATAHTVIAPGLLSRQLEHIRRVGFATTTQEMTLGACSVAVPIRDGPVVVAGLGVVVPSLAGNRRASLVAALQVAAAGIGRTLAAHPGVWGQVPVTGERGARGGQPPG